MSRKGKGALFALSAAAGYSIFKAVREFIDYQKLKNKDVYINAEAVDIQDMRPVIRKSICTGEEEAGFKDASGRFTSYMLIKSDADLEIFRKKYDIQGDIPVEY